MAAETETSFEVWYTDATGQERYMDRPTKEAAIDEAVTLHWQVDAEGNHLLTNITIQKVTKTYESVSFNLEKIASQRDNPADQPVEVIWEDEPQEAVPPPPSPTVVER